MNGEDRNKNHKTNVLYITVSDLPMDDMSGGAHPCFVSAWSKESHELIHADG